MFSLPEILSAALLLLPVQAPLEEGSVAPPGCWTTAGGCPARTGASLSAPLLDHPVEAWRYGPATFEGEPRVWGSRVFAAARDSRSRRTLHVLDVETGRLLFHRRFTASVPLDVSVWEDVLALRTSPERAELFRLRGGRLVQARTLQHAGGVSPPLVVGDAVFLREGDELVCRDVARRDPVWRARVDGVFRGTPSVRGNEVWAVWYDAAGNAHVASFDRRTGQRHADSTAGHHGRASLASDAETALVVGAEHVFVEYALPALSSDDDGYSWGRLSRQRPSRAALHPFGTAPLPFGDGWLVKESQGRKHRRWIAARADEEGLRARVLAEGERQGWLTASEVAGSRAGSIAYLGASAVSVEEYDIRWRRDVTLDERPVPIDGGVLWVVGDSLRALRSGGPPPSAAVQRADATVAELDGRLAHGLGQLAGKALRAGDLPRTEALLREALNRGVDESALERTRVALEQKLAGSRPPVPDRRRLKAVDKEERALRTEPVEALLEQAAARSETTVARELVRRVLARAPESEAAAKLVDRMVPREFPRKRGEELGSWLDFLDVHARTPVRFVEDVDGWKRSVGGYRSDRLLVLTTPGRPGAVARSLEVGELVCDLLEELFGARAGNAVEPLTLHLYETREEYVRESQKARSGPEVALGWTAGHYSSADNLSRMFVPADDRAYAELLGVYAHELTHHWLAARAPFASAQTSGNPLDLPGYWIAEGFATLIEEFRLDPQRGTWSPDNPRAASLDTVANATDDQLLPWDLVLSSSYAGFAQLSAHADRKIPLTWKLGAHAERSEIQMFYAQAGAAAHYLFNADGGRHRQALLDFVAAWYRGTPRALDVQLAFGTSPKKLGRRIRAYAEETLASAIE